MKSEIYCRTKFEMEYFDFHTHRDKKNSCKSCTFEDLQRGLDLLENQKISLQFHPWHLPEKYGGLPEDFIETAKSDNIYAIGEIGLDRLQGPSLEVQKAYLKDLLNLAEGLHKPVILHVVRCADEILQMLKNYPALTVIWHGFRGKKELFERLVKANIFVSLHHSMLDKDDFTDYLKQNSKYHNKIGLESDDCELEIEELYRTLESKINE